MEIKKSVLQIKDRIESEVKTSQSFVFSINGCGNPNERRYKQ